MINNYNFYVKKIEGIVIAGNRQFLE